MEDSDVGKIILIIIMVMFSAMFSGTETAYSSVNKLRLKNLASKGNKRAETALKLANRYEDVLTAVLIGNNIVNITASSVSTILFLAFFGSRGTALSTLVITIVILTCGEILPKSYAKKNPEKIAIAAAAPLSLLVTVFKPIVWCFNKLSTAVSGNGETPVVTEDELKYMIDEIEEQGVLEEQESDLVKSALEFDDITVNEILIPRVKITGVDITADIDEIKEIFISEMYSRLPVYEKSMDNIIGIITNKAFYKMLSEGGSDIRTIIQEVPHITDSKLISLALRDMQRSKVHLAVVTDQYGGTKGIITLEDIIEELVGEIYDEDDEIVTNIIRTDENCYEVAGDTNIDEFLEFLDLDDDMISTTCTSVGGWVTDVMEHIPETGETAVSGIFKITVTAMNEQTVEKVLIEISDDLPDDESSGSESE